MEVSPNQQQQEEQHVRRSYSKSMQQRGTYLDIYIPSGSIGVVCKVSGDNRACEVSEITDKAPKKIRKGDILQSLDGIRLTFDTLLEACVSTVDRINRRLVVFRPEYSPYRDAQNSTTCENSSSIATATTASHKRAMQDAGNRNENEHISDDMKKGTDEVGPPSKRLRTVDQNCARGSNDEERDNSNAREEGKPLCVPFQSLARTKKDRWGAILDALDLTQQASHVHLMRLPEKGFSPSSIRENGRHSQRAKAMYVAVMNEIEKMICPGKPSLLRSLRFPEQGLPPPQQKEPSTSSGTSILTTASYLLNGSHQEQYSIATPTSIDGNAVPSARKCVPLKPPIPSKFQGNMEFFKSARVPEFMDLVNFPSLMSHQHAAKSLQTDKLPLGLRRCVMCGIACPHSNLFKKTLGTTNSQAIIPTQNKGLCTLCDVNVWVVVANGLEIKWCKGCKNFRPWAAFGEKGSGTKCVRCRDRQREKYAMQKQKRENAKI